MGEFTDKAKGLGNQVAGKTKEVAGDATGDARLESEGKLQQAKGKAQKVSGEIKGAAGDRI